MSKPTYILAGGGTGGHLYPGLAVLEELDQLIGDSHVIVACSDRDVDRRILSTCQVAMVAQPVKPFPRRPWQILPFMRGWRASKRLARDLLRDVKPDAVIGLGGFASGPVVKQAHAAGVPVALLNPDAVAGKANKYLSRYADVIFTQFESTRNCFATAIQDRVRQVGCPVRREFVTATRQEALDLFGLCPDHKTLLINGGSLGASSINEAIAALENQLESLADTWQLLHICGPSRIQQVSGPQGTHRMRIVRMGYCERMDLAYAAADLALCRCGASTAAELSIAHTPAIIMPYPYHRDQHQRLNSQMLESCGAAIVCTDAKDPAANAEMLRRQMLELMRDPERLTQMRQASSQIARPDAAREVAQWLVDRKH